MEYVLLHEYQYLWSVNTLKFLPWLGVTNTPLTLWGRVMHICVSKLTIIASDNDLSPGRRQAIIWTNAGISLIGTLGTNLSEIFCENQTFSFKNMYLKMSSGKWRPFCLGLNVLTTSSVRRPCLSSLTHWDRNKNGSYFADDTLTRIFLN